MLLVVLILNINICLPLVRTVQPQYMRTQESNK